jgi:Uma2 family endonuclease
MLAKHSTRIGENYWDKADLVMEVVSDDPVSRERDLEEKRKAYAAAGIPEYWIVDPQERRITVLKRTGKTYAVHSQCPPGERAESALLKGFAVNASGVFRRSAK